MQDGKNLNPTVQEKPTLEIEKFEKLRLDKELRFLEADMITDEDMEDELDEYEIFDMIRHINDPEHPLTLEQLSVVKPESVVIDREHNLVTVNFTPTIPNCSMATMIGLMIRVKLQRCLPSMMKVDVLIAKGKHD